MVERVSGKVRIRRQRADRVAAGYLWLFAGDLDRVEGNPAPGDLVDVELPFGKFAGRGFYNPQSKIHVRLLTLEDEPIDDAFWRRRIREAVVLRARVVAGTNAYRLLYAEGDRLPGLIVDRYGDLLVMQAVSYGMDQRKEHLARLLCDESGASAVYARHDAKSRVLEGLPLERRFLLGEHPTTVEIYEGKARFMVDVERGQKTGWFCDQRENREAVADLSEGADVLEVFCHTGAFGIRAGLAGAAAVRGVDVSQEALGWARRHADMNGLATIASYQSADAFEALRELDRQGARFDMVIVDPPAFARSKHAVPHAIAGYKEINLRALRLLRPGGFLVTCSCSQHVGEGPFMALVVEAARDAGKQLRLLEARSQSRDHPVLVAMPETRYLKCLLFQAW